MTSKDQKHISDAYNKEHNRLLGWIKKQVSDNFEAEDILQDVFYQLTVGFRDLQTIENLSSWLYRVAGNKIIDRRRKKKPRNFSSMEKNNNGIEKTLNLSDILPDLHESPEETELKELIWEEIQLSLEEMPQEQAEVFIMHEFEDKSFREISDLTGISVNTLISRKRYAVLNLRQELTPLYNLIKS